LKKKEQQDLIKKIIDSPKSNQDCKEFKKLQMHWYKKLEAETDYKDIERTGTMRHKYYDEYGGLIKHYSWLIAAKYDFSAHKHYSLLRKISWNAIVTSNSSAFNDSKPSKSLSLDDFNAFSGTNTPSLPTSEPHQSIKLQKLSKVDSKILYLAGDGKHIREISKYLRRYLSHHASRSKTGPKGKPFSVFFVHNRLHKLINSIQDGSIVEMSPEIQKFMKNSSTSLIETPKTQESEEGGGVKKTGKELNSYIYTENNND
jgi:hypothetical protein